MHVFSEDKLEQTHLKRKEILKRVFACSVANIGPSNRMEKYWGRLVPLGIPPIAVADCFAPRLSRRRGGLFGPRLSRRRGGSYCPSLIPPTCRIVLPLAYPADVADCFAPRLSRRRGELLPLVYPAVTSRIAFLPFVYHFLLVLWTSPRFFCCLLDFGFVIFVLLCLGVAYHVLLDGT